MFPKYYLNYIRTLTWAEESAMKGGWRRLGGRPGGCEVIRVESIGRWHIHWVLVKLVLRLTARGGHVAQKPERNLRIFRIELLEGFVGIRQVHAQLKERRQFVNDLPMVH